jgi:hypothetical protein
MSTQVAVEQKTSVVNSLDELVRLYSSTQKSDAATRDAFLMATGIVAAAQRIFTNNRNHAPALCQIAAKVLSELSQLPWGAVDFPVDRVLSSQTYANIFTENNVRDADKNRVLLEALFTFVALLQENADYAKEPVLRGIVADSVQTKTIAAPAPELNYRANILKIFDPGAVTAIDLEPLAVVVYRGELLGGGFGPELWGLAYIKGEEAHVLLETGEYVQTPALSLSFAVTKNYDTSELPPYLLACAKLFMPVILSQVLDPADPSTQETIERLGKHFGNFTTNPSLCVLPILDLEACENVIDKARWGRHDTADGAMKMVDVPDTNLKIIVTAQHAAIRPYITSTLVNAETGAILMRLDVPREFTSRGVYLFPLNGKSSVLIVV